MQLLPQLLMIPPVVRLAAFKSLKVAAEVRKRITLEGQEKDELSVILSDNRQGLKEGFEKGFKQGDEQGFKRGAEHWLKQGEEKGIDNSLSIC